MKSVVEDAAENFETKSSSSSRSKMDINDYEMHGVLGEGSYGKVYLATEKAT
jgi:serine/threonine protein kinase